MKKIIFTSWLFLLLMIACQNEVKKYSRETVILEQYLHDEFGINFSKKDKEVVLLVVCDFGCKPCVKKTFESIIDNVDASAIENFYVLYSKQKEVPNYFQNHAKLLYDADGKYNVLDLPIASLSIIKLKNGMITSITSVQSNKIDSTVKSECSNYLKLPN